MIESLTEPFAGGIAQRALAEVILLGAVCGPLSVWINLYRQSYAAESLSHAALPGLVLASLAGAPLLLGAAGGLAVAALAIGLASRIRGVATDSAVAVVVSALFGLGVLLALNPEVPPRLVGILFGDPLGVSLLDLALAACLVLATLGGLRWCHRSLSLAAFDPEASRSLGGDPARARITLLVLLAATILIAVQALGNLLVAALLIAPGAAALRGAARLPHAFRTCAVFAIGSGIGGLYLSHYFELATGASIALCAVASYGVAVALSAARGRPVPSEAPAMPAHR